MGEVSSHQTAHRTGTTARILVVDDNPATRRFVRDTLELEGHEVVEAAGGADALASCATTVPDLVVIDLCLTDMRGTDVCERLREQCDPVPRIVVFTGAPEDAPASTGLFDGLITKPADPAALADTIASHLHRTRMVGQPTSRNEGRPGPARSCPPRRDTEHGLDDALERGRAELAVLRGLAEVVSGSGDLDGAMAEALARCLHAIGASRGAVFLCELDGSLTLRAHLGDVHRLPGLRLPFPEATFRQVLQSGESRAVGDEVAGPTTLVVPVSSGDQRYGVLVVEVPRAADHRIWTQFLAVVGLGLGFAVAHARRADAGPLPHDPAQRDDPDHDPLTGLAGAARLDRDLEAALAARADAAGALLLVDVDRLGQVNDALGHRTGDELLKGVARCLESVSGPGTTVARLHADVFAVLAVGRAGDGWGEPAAVRLARQVLGALESPIRCNGYTLYTTASVGLAVFPGHGTRAAGLLQRAHTALGLAKRRGGNSIETYTQRSGDDLWRRLTLDQGLRAALEREQFRLHYQPVVDLSTGRAAEVEALLRWDRPLHGITPAGAFIPVAEESGLIVAIGSWVLRQAAEQAGRWHAAGVVDRVAVNVGAREFHQGHVYDALVSVLDQTGTEPSGLALEITETVALSDVDHAVAVLDRVRDLGVHTALDDFGTGYSSLRYLQELPVDTLKIDRSLVANAAADPDRGGAILAGVVDLAHRLEMRVVAEGIEDRTGLELVRTLGCDAAQGYHLGRPVPPTDLFRPVPVAGSRGQRQPCSTTSATNRSS